MLQPFPCALRRAWLADPAALAAATGLRLAPDWPNPNFAAVVPLIADRVDTDDWVFLVVDAGVVRGEIGAKGPPDAEGEVEIGYGIAPSGRRRGLAAGALAAFVALAAARGLRAIRADCLMENAGSIRTLEKNAFERVGVGQDEDGPLIRWRRSLP